MAQAWFKTRRSDTGGTMFPKPLTWQGWAVNLGMVFVVAMLAQMIGRWALTMDFKPLGAGIWLIAGLFLVLGLYFRIVRIFSETRE
ncbi:MAG: hypothetical protein R3C52_13620 [Hyphomonadaceae bacterium]